MTTSQERIRKALAACEATKGADKPYEVYSEFRGELARACHEDAIAALLAELDLLRAANNALLDQMHHFAHADQRLWDESMRDLESFKSWVQSRAAHMLATPPAVPDTLKD